MKQPETQSHKYTQHKQVTTITGNKISRPKKRCRFVVFIHPIQSFSSTYPDLLQPNAVFLRPWSTPPHSFSRTINKEVEHPHIMTRSSESTDFGPVAETQSSFDLMAKLYAVRRTAAEEHQQKTKCLHTSWNHQPEVEGKHFTFIQRREKRRKLSEILQRSENMFL